ncbi:hypothetical protein Hanom_Chr09g00855881 [Helianthus anomalus]
MVLHARTTVSLVNIDTMDSIRTKYIRSGFRTNSIRILRFQCCSWNLHITIIDHF